MQTLRLQAATAVTLALLAGCCSQPQKRDPAMRASFMANNPCPINQAKRGPCPGYHVDHITPLCAGGADHPNNMQWLTIKAHQDKTRDDIRRCRNK